MSAHARAPPAERRRLVTTTTHVRIHLPSNGRNAAMANTDRISDFLNAVDGLRGEDDAVRTTAHTSSVSAEGWAAAEQTDPADPQE